MSWLRYWSYSFFLYAVFKVHVDRLFYQSLETWTVSEVFHELTVKVVLKPCFRTSSFNFKSLITGKTSYQNSTALLIGLASAGCGLPLPVSMLKESAQSCASPVSTPEPSSYLFLPVFRSFHDTSFNPDPVFPLGSFFQSLAATCSPTPSPVQYHRPPKA